MKKSSSLQFEVLTEVPDVIEISGKELSLKLIDITPSFDIEDREFVTESIIDLTEKNTGRLIATFTLITVSKSESLIIEVRDFESNDKKITIQEIEKYIKSHSDEFSVEYNIEYC